MIFLDKLNNYNKIVNYKNKINNDLKEGLLELLKNDPELVDSNVRDDIRTSINNVRVLTETKEIVFDKFDVLITTFKNDVKEFNIEVSSKIGIIFNKVEELRSCLSFDKKLIDNFSNYDLSNELATLYRIKLLDSSKTVNLIKNSEFNNNITNVEFLNNVISNVNGFIKFDENMILLDNALRTYVDIISSYVDVDKEVRDGIIENLKTMTDLSVFEVGFSDGEVNKKLLISFMNSLLNINRRFNRDKMISEKIVGISIVDLTSKINFENHDINKLTLESLISIDDILSNSVDIINNVLKSVRDMKNISNELIDRENKYK